MRPDVGNLRVLLIINGTDFGGTESALAELAKRLTRRGHDVHVLSLKRLGRLGLAMREAGVRVSSLEMAEDVSTASMLRAIPKLAVWLRGRDFDVVQSFLPRANIVSRISNRLSGRRRPHLSSERSTDFKRGNLICRLNRVTAPWTDRVLAISTMVRDVLVERDGLAADRIALLENGIDVGKLDAMAPVDLRPALPGVGPDDVLFCAVGRLVPDKGYRYLLRAFARMEHRERMQLALVGEGPHEKSLRELAQREGLRDRVHFVGFRSDVPSLLKTVDGVVLPSLEEGVPVVLLEAMACRRPIVATAVGGVPDLVAEGVTALVVPPAEDWCARALGRALEQTPDALAERGVNALAAALDRLVGDPELRARLGRAGRERIETHFTLDRIVARLEGYYRDAISAPGPDRGASRPVEQPSPV